MNYKLFGFAFFLYVFSINSFSITSCVSCGSSHNTLNVELKGPENNIGISVLSDTITTAESKYKRAINQEAQWWLSYKGEPVIKANSSTTDWSYRPIDEYISIAVKGYHPECNRTFYAPFNVLVLNNEDCSPSIASSTDGTFMPVSLQTSIKITKKIINGTYSKNVYYADMGVCQPSGCSSKQAILNQLFINLNITAPQKCEINAGQVVTIDFGNISVGSFGNAGEAANGVEPIVKSIAIECDNIQVNSELTMRIQANKVSGNAIVSSNNDVGFIIADNNTGKAITPNNISSLIPFLLDSNARAIIPIRVYPISITGSTPAEGPISSEGFLRVDFP